MLTPVSELTRAALRGRAGADVMLYGLVLMLVISFLPNGLMGLIGAKRAGRGKAGVVTLLEVEGLVKRFGGLQAVGGLDLRVDAGEIVGLIGPNGAGKTTVFHLIAGFHAPTSGAIRFKGASIVGLKPHAICRRGLARTFQIVQPFAGLCTLDNVMVGAFNRVADVAAARGRAREIIDFVGLGPQARRPRADAHAGGSQAARDGARPRHRGPSSCSSTRSCPGSTRRRSTRSSASSAASTPAA